MEDHSKLCPFSEDQNNLIDESIALQDYYRQRKSNLCGLNERPFLLSLSLNSKFLPNIKNSLHRLKDLMSPAPSPEYFRSIVREKIQNQEDLHTKCDRNSSEYVQETNQKLSALQDSLDHRNELLQQIYLAQQNQVSLMDQVENLKLRIETEQKNLLIIKSKKIKSQIEPSVSESQIERTDHAIAELREKIQNIEIETSNFENESKLKLEEKTGFKEELRKKLEQLKEEQKSIIEENLRLTEVLSKNHGNIGTQNRLNISANSNFSQEIDELKNQIEEIKILQKSSISDKCSILEPYNQLLKKHENASSLQLESEINRISNNFTALFSNTQSILQNSLKRSAEIQKPLADYLKGLNMQNIKSTKSITHSLLVKYKTLLQDSKSSEISLKSLDLKDKDLDSFKIQNSLDP